jgi:hypothetical protein
MNLELPIFLVTKAVEVQERAPEIVYNEILNLNVLECDRASIFCELKGQATTHSKTMSRPGDDDPDPGRSQCY